MTQASGSLYHRGGNASGWSGSWREILDSSNYNSYAPKKDGTGASGTWGISITGNAATATKATQDGDGKVISSTYAYKQGIVANGGFPSGATAYGMLLSAKPHVNGSTTGNDNYYLLVDSERKFWIGTKLNTTITPTWVQMASVAYVSDNYATKTEMDKCYNSTISRGANTVLAAPNGQDGTASFRKLVLADLPSGIKAATLAGDYTGSGGQQPPSYVRTNAVKCNMMSGFVGTTTTFSSYADVLMMNAYSWSDVPYATALAIQKTSGVPRAWIAAGGNTDKWGGVAELITSNNIGTQSVASATTATKLGSTTIGGAGTPIYLSSGTPTACTVIKSGTGDKSLLINDTSTNTASTCAFAAGNGLTAGTYQFVIGHYNVSMTGSSNSGSTGNLSMFIIGNGTSSSKSNAFRVTNAGTVYAKSSTLNTGADYAEYFEWQDGNISREDRRGYFVTMNGEKIKIAQPGDYILGIVSALPSVIGNGDEDWRGRYVYDEFGAFIDEEFEYEEEVSEEVVDEETGDTTTITKTVTKTGTKFKENPDYDPTIPYVERKDRPEWDAVGMVGVLAVRDDGTCQVNSYCKVAPGGIATSSDSGYRVIQRVNDHIVKVILK